MQQHFANVLPCLYLIAGLIRTFDLLPTYEIHPRIFAAVRIILSTSPPENLRVASRVKFLNSYFWKSSADVLTRELYYFVYTLTLEGLRLPRGDRINLSRLFISPSLELCLLLFLHATLPRRFMSFEILKALGLPSTVAPSSQSYFSRTRDSRDTFKMSWKSISCRYRRHSVHCTIQETTERLGWLASLRHRAQ